MVANFVMRISNWGEEDRRFELEILIQSAAATFAATRTLHPATDSRKKGYVAMSQSSTFQSRI